MGQEAKWAGRISRKSARSPASASRFTKTKPPQVPTLASGRQKVSGSTWGKSQGQGIPAKVPSRRQVNPWKGQRNSLTVPGWVRSRVPRWRQELWKARIRSGALRTTMREKPAMS
jgi:hypothetical protein